MKGKLHQHKHPRAAHAKGGVAGDNPTTGKFADDESPSDVYAGGSSNVVKEAKEKIAAISPDVIFLDIQMPGKTGLELLEEISALPEVVFVTAYDEYAIRAFEINALD